MDALSTKTTFYLANPLRIRLKELAARRGRSVTDLLAEGAELVLARYQGDVDTAELVRRAAAARRKLRQGYYSGPPAADRADELIYGAAAAAEPGRPYAAPRRRRAS